MEITRIDASSDEARKLSYKIEIDLHYLEKKVKDLSD